MSALLEGIMNLIGHCEGFPNNMSRTEITHYASVLALQLRYLKASESMGNHDSEIVGAGSVD